MARLNVDHLGLFLVERVPLVFQQAAAIRMDTGKTFLIFYKISECLDKIEMTIAQNCQMMPTLSLFILLLYKCPYIPSVYKLAEADSPNPNRVLFGLM